jgi:uncharacterized membrane protein (Fun14 family)
MLAHRVKSGGVLMIAAFGAPDSGAVPRHAQGGLLAPIWNAAQDLLRNVRPSPVVPTNAVPSLPGPFVPPSPHAAAAVFGAASQHVQGAATDGIRRAADFGGSAVAAASAFHTSIQSNNAFMPVSDLQAEQPKSGASSAPALSASAMAQEVTVGSVAGFCSGYALKKIGKVAAVGVGVLFITVQVANHQRRSSGADEDSLLVTKRDFERLNRALVTTLDADGDGVVSSRDMQTHLKQVVSVLGLNMPSGAAFTTAFLLGLKMG